MSAKLWISLLNIWIIYLMQAMGFDKGNFKSFEDTDFCKLYRRNGTNDGDIVSSLPPRHQFSLNQASLKVVDKGKLQVILEQSHKIDIVYNEGVSSVETLKSQHLLHFELRHDMMRIYVEDNLDLDHFKITNRYRLLENDVLEHLSKDSLSEIQIDQVNSTLSKIHWRNYSMQLSSSPFLVEVFKENMSLIKLNEENFILIETCAIKDPIKKSDMLALGLDVSFPGSSHLYGIPEHATQLALKPTHDSCENKRSYSSPYRLYNLDVYKYTLDNPLGLYGSIPFLMSMSPDPSRPSIGFFWANPSETWIDITYDASPLNARAHWMSESGAFEAYIFLGPSPKDILNQFTTLTGRPTFPPLFSIGYHQCRWNYNDEEDLLTVHHNFTKHDTPVDVLWLDIEHTDGKRYLTWDTFKFPDPIGVQKELSSIHRKLVTIVDPHIKQDSSYHIYSEALARDLFVKDEFGKVFEGHCWPGKSSWIDFTNPNARDWWKSKFLLEAYKGSTKDLYIWNDMNEPSVFESFEVTMPKRLVHYNNRKHFDIHNLYGLYLHMATMRAIEERNNARAFVLSRSFFAGSQKYGPVWTGDNEADWGHLKASIPMILTLSISGLAFAGADVGGFFGDPNPELLSRWYQLGAFLPFFRGHAHIKTQRREPWLLGEPWMRYIKAAIQTRYELLPYWYTLFYEASVSGTPMVRPLFFDHPKEVTTFDIDDQFCLGSHLLVAPVLAPGANETWYNYFTFRKIPMNHYHSKRIEFPVSLSTIPVFAKAGSIIPIKKRNRQSSELMHNDPFALIIFLDDHGNASGNLYLDDGMSFDYKSGIYQYRSIAATSNHISLTLSSVLVSGNPHYEHVKKTLPITSVSGKVEEIVFIGLSAAVKDISASVETGKLSKTFDFVNYSQDEHVVTIVKLPLLPIHQDWSLILSH